MDEYEISLGMPTNLPKRFETLISTTKVSRPAVKAVTEGKQLIVLGAPIEAAAYGLRVANEYGHFNQMSNMVYMDANRFMKAKITDDPCQSAFDNFDHMLGQADVIVWSFLSYVSQNIAHEIDTAICARITEDRINIVTGWNQPTDRLKLDKEVRNDLERGYPLLAHYALSTNFSSIVSADTEESA